MRMPRRRIGVRFWTRWSRSPDGRATHPAQGVGRSEAAAGTQPRLRAAAGLVRSGPRRTPTRSVPGPAYRVPARPPDPQTLSAHHETGRPGRRTSLCLNAFQGGDHDARPHHTRFDTRSSGRIRAARPPASHRCQYRWPLNFLEDGSAEHRQVVVNCPTYVYTICGDTKRFR